MALSYTTVEGSIGSKLDKIYGVKYSFLRVNPGKCLMPPQFVFIGPKIRDFEVYDDDIWLVSYPRTGSHWVHEMLWLLGNDLNYEKAKNTHVFFRSPLLESSSLMVSGSFVEWFNKLGESVDLVENLPRPRYVKTHLPMPLLPRQLHEKRPKIVYVTRNPKDTCVSFYHFCQVFLGMNCTFEEFAELMLTENAPKGPYWDHVLPFWERRNDENILFLKYEEMKQDLQSTIKKAAKFMNKSIEEKETEQLADHLSFEKMAANPSINYEQLLAQRNVATDDQNSKFIRKGKIGDWRHYMSSDLSRRFDEWTEKNLKGTGLKFVTEHFEREE